MARGRLRRLLLQMVVIQNFKLMMIAIVRLSNPLLHRFGNLQAPNLLPRDAEQHLLRAQK